MEPIPIKLHLNFNDDDSGDDDTPRRLVRLPSGQILAYGGVDGTITCLQHQSTQSFGASEAVTVQRFDDAVQAVAVSSDGKRVAVGFESGATEIYCFDEYEASSSSPHPFAASSAKSSGDLDDDEMFSQDPNLSLKSENVFAGPKFDVPIRDLKFHPSCKASNSQPHILAVASEETFCVVDVSTANDLAKQYLQMDAEKHHDHGGIRGLSFTETLLCSLDMNGRLCVWSTNGRPNTWKLLHREFSSCVPKKDVGMIHGADAFDQSCLPLASSSYIVTPGQHIPTVRRIDSSVLKGFKPLELPKESIPSNNDEGHIDSIVGLAIKEDSTLFTSGRDGRVISWKMDNEHVTIQKRLHQFPLAPTYLFLDKDDLYVLFPDGKCSCLPLSPRPKAAAETKIKPKVTFGKLDDTLLVDSDDDDNGDFELGPLNTQPPTKSNIRIDDDDDDDDNDDDLMGGTSLADKNDKNNDKPKESSPVADNDLDQDESNVGGNFEDFISFAASVDEDVKDKDGLNDGGAGGSQSDVGEGMGANDIDGDDDDDGGVDDDDLESVPRSLYNRPKPQAAFAPSSTPLGLSRRFLCWNHIGAVTLLRAEDSATNRNTVDITFTDSTAHRPVSFTDTINFILGSLGEDGGIFASDLQEDVGDADDGLLEDVVGDLNMSEQTKAALKRNMKKRSGKFDQSKGSSIYFHRFETFGSNREKDWYLTLPDGERVTGAACGRGWAAVTTSRRFLRMYSSGGNQGHVVWLKGYAVTIAGRSRFMAVIYHEGDPLADGTQALGYTLYDAVSFRVVFKGPLSCLSSGSTISWIGFSNDYSLLVMDSAGMLSMLVADHAGKVGVNYDWVPVVDTVKLRKNVSETIWPVTAHDGKLICVPLKGTQYPDAGRRPVTSMLPMRWQFAQGINAKMTALEELSVRSNVALRQKKLVFLLGATEVSKLDDFDEEYTVLCAQVDKVTLKLFASLVDTNKHERALDLIDRLHLEKSFDLAIRLAGQHYRLVNLIEGERDRRFSSEDWGTDEEDGEEDQHASQRSSSSRMVSPEMPNRKHKDGPDHRSESLKRRRVQFD